MTEVRLLGPVEVALDGRRVSLGAARSESLLVRLLLVPNQVVSVDRLIDDLWPGEPPERAALALRSLVSRLRRRLREAGARDGVLETRPPGYLVTVEPGELDVERFESLQARARAHAGHGEWAAASEYLTAAVGLWRGPALGEVAVENFARGEAARLDELHLAALEERAEAELALGHHRELVGELELLTARHPLRERLWAQRMLALYRCGRQAEALQTFQDVRRLLDEELGLAPGVELMRLEQDVLRQSADLQLGAVATAETSSSATQPAAARPAAPPPGVRLVGRDRELAALVQWTGGEAGAERAAVVVVAGEAGIGKTRLLEEFARQAEASGVLVLWGRCDQDTLVPYQPFVEVLRGFLETVPSDRRDAVLGWRLAEISRVLPDVGVRPEPGASTDAEMERYRFFEAVASLLVEVSRERRTLVVLDDVHWADRGAAMLLRHVLRGADDTDLTVVVSCRPSVVAGDDVAGELIADLERTPTAERLALTGLDDAEIAELLAEQQPGAPRSVATELRALTGGNPLFVVELLRHLDGASVAPELRTGLDDLLPTERLRDLIARRVSRLAESVNRLLAAGAVIGSEFEATVAARAAGLDEDELLFAIEEAMRAQLVRESATSDDRYEFTHALVRRAVYDNLLSSRRLRLHHRVAVALEEIYGEDPVHLAAVAHHLTQAGLAGDPEKTARFARAAGMQARTKFAHDEAVLHLQRALGAMARSNATAADRCDVLLALAEAQNSAGDPHGGEESWRQAAALARGLSDPTYVARAALREGPLSYLGVLEPRAEEMALLEEAVDALGPEDRGIRAMVLARLALTLSYTGAQVRADQCTEEAVAIARRVGDDRALCYALNSRLHALRGFEVADERLRVGTELRDVARRIGDLFLGFHGWMFRLRELIAAADLGTVRAELPGFEQMAAEASHPLFRSYAMLVRSTVVLIEGDVTASEQLATDSVPLGARDNEMAVSFWAAQMLWTWWQRGVMPSLEKAFGEIIDAAPTGIPVVRTGLAWLLAEVGRTDDARTQLELLAGDDFATIASDQTEGLAPTIVTLVCYLLGESELGRRLYERYLPYAGTIIVSRPPAAATFGPADHYLGLLAGMWDRDAAIGHLEAAVALCERVESPAFLSAARCELGRLLIEDDNEATRMRGRGLLEAASTAAAALGLERVVDRAGERS